jgi:hypothetical protein
MRVRAYAPTGLAGAGGRPGPVNGTGQTLTVGRVGADAAHLEPDGLQYICYEQWKPFQRGSEADEPAQIRASKGKHGAFR